jgi:3-deoxy-D-manno-octulosonate 8-phosphate phosphatase (KDO 8-P phosphatase)
MSALKIFEDNGGKFHTPEKTFIGILETIKAFVFDWDGVFTNGEKDHDLQSRFNEVDSMGTNLLRFTYYLKNGKLPITSIISGENNRSAFTFVNRECFHSAYYKAGNKLDAADHLCKTHGIQLHEIAFVFDDVLDLGLAQKSGLRIYIPRKANSQLNTYVTKNKLADYFTAAESGEFPVRESCELLISAYGMFDEAVKHRMEITETYRKYMDLRRSVKPEFYTSKDGIISSGTV